VTHCRGVQGLVPFAAVAYESIRGKSAMTLLERTKLALANFSTGLPGARTLLAEEAGQRLTCELAALDSLACAFTELSVASDVLAGAAPQQLKQLADRLSRQLTYLLEPVSPIEADDEQCIVQMRSNPPQREDGQTSYYELLVRRGGDINLCRYGKQPGQPRQPIAAQVTREVLLRLVADFSAALV
jgi:hypothetical protein